MKFALLLLAALLAPLAGCIFVHGGTTVLPVIVSDSPAAADAYQIRSKAPIGVEGAPELKLALEWQGDHATATLRNEGKTAVPVHDVVLFDYAHKLPGDTAFYGEGFQMLSQTAGTIAKPVDLEQYTDRGHYRLPEPAGFRSVYGVAMFSRPDPSRLLVGFASCRRFVGRIDVSTSRIRAVLDGDGIAIEPGETWQLEDLVVASGPDRDELFARLAYWIERNHPRRPWPSPPRGWCSWYCFGPNVTAKNVLDNAEAIAKRVPKLDLEYVQIDDGYQPVMGDWLEPNPAFGDLRGTIEGIIARGLKPAIWIAPFIASEDSKLFREHPDWFVKADDGKPLRSDTVGFGGWRQGPWYCLDGTHPDAQAHLRDVFNTFRSWGIEYFKLDALYWGAIRGGHFLDPRATRVAAYRQGLASLGASDSFLLGCNHALWPSLGLLDGSRSSMDADRNWESIARIGRQNLMRAWQNDRLWWNDPDCVLFTKDSPPEQVKFQIEIAHLTGGLRFSGDDLSTLTPYTHTKVLDLLKLDRLPPPQLSEDGWTAEVGWGGYHYLYLFNPTDEPVKRVLPSWVRLGGQEGWKPDGDLFSADINNLVQIPPHAVRLFCRDDAPPVYGHTVLH
jgi:alpha-galactosidase